MQVKLEAEFLSSYYNEMSAVANMMVKAIMLVITYMARLSQGQVELEGELYGRGRLPQAECASGFRYSVTTQHVTSLRPNMAGHVTCYNI